MTENRKNQYAPDHVSPPGETLQETLDALGMSQAELAERTGRPTKTINEIIKGKAAITSETALQLERSLGVPASFWHNRERNYRDALARQAERKRLEAQVQWLRKVPVRGMVKLGWINQFQDKVEQLREVLSFFGVTSPEQWDQVWLKMSARFRHSPSFKSDLDAMAAWLRKGELDSQRIRCAPYDDIKFHQVLTRIRELTLQPPEVFAPELLESCRHAGVTAVFVRLPPKVRAYGASRWLTTDKALIQLSLRHKSDDHLWFSFFHEAGHILYDGKREIHVDEERSERGIETRANKFAEDILIPSDRLRSLITKGDTSKTAIRRFATQIGIAPGIVVGRLQHEGFLPHSHCNDLKRRLEWADDL